MRKAGKDRNTKVRAAALLITLGVVYGDIGTSPMYVMKSVVGECGVNRTVILGTLSLIVWTMTLLTTVKYVAVAMKADNHGEGGIFSLYGLVRRYGRYFVFPAILGGAALLADGILTPAVTVTTAVEGLRSIPAMNTVLGTGQSLVVVITVLILAVLFLIQRAGTSVIGKAFGPVMLVWFLFLGVTGLVRAASSPWIFQALNPLWAVRVLLSPENRSGVMILGCIFLSVTGAEALYSDMGHVGKENIYRSWPFVKVCLLLNYFGQGAWLLQQMEDGGAERLQSVNSFFMMLPAGLRPFAVILGTAAAVIASQALITGSFTLVSEAGRLDLLPHMQIIYPSETKGQLYLPLVNLIIWAGCTGVVLLFRSSARMEAAYGLSITVTMLMTTLLLHVYLERERKKRLGAWIFLIVFGGIELTFFYSSLTKFFRGGYVAVLFALVLVLIMLVWKKGTEIEQMQAVRLELEQYIPMLDRLRRDEKEPLFTDNLVYITNQKSMHRLDRDILYSILNRRPKRANAYWFLNVEVTDEPYTREYHVDRMGTDFVFCIRLRLGFRVDQRINVYLRQIITELMESGELPPQDKKYSIYPMDPVGDFRFVILRKNLVPESEVSAAGRAAISAKYAIRHICGSPARWYGLESSWLFVEYVPLFLRTKRPELLTRV